MCNVLSKRGSCDLVFDVLVSPKLCERHGYSGIAEEASIHQRRHPILTHHERAASKGRGGLMLGRC